MLALLQAIEKRFNDSGLSGTFPGGFWRDRAPEGTSTMPYVVVNLESSPTTTYYGNAHYNDCAVQFTVYGVGHDATGAATEALDAKFNDTTLSLQTGTNVNCYRMFEPKPALQVNVDQNGNEVWAWLVTYIYSVRN